MSSKKLSRVKGKRLELLCNKVNELKPGAITDKLRDEWRSIDDVNRMSSINTFFTFNQRFSDKELHEIHRHVFRRKIPWKLISFILSAGAIAYLVFSFIEYKKLPRVYTYGNNISVYSTADVGAEKYDQLDIYGEKFTTEGKDVIASNNSMILIDSSHIYVKVTEDNFLKWIWPGRKEGFIKREEVIVSASEYEEYKSIYQTLRGSSDLLRLENNLRLMIREMIKNTPSLGNATLGDDYSKDGKVGYSKILSTAVIDGSSYIFLRLKTASGNKNFVIHHVGQIFGDIKELTENNMDPIRNPGFFKEQETAGSSPDILFYDIITKREKKSVLPPYQRFNSN